jgi:hypothetical protein
MSVVETRVHGQQEFLRTTKTVPELTWDELVAAAGVEPGAFNNSRMPNRLQKHRGSP